MSRFLIILLILFVSSSTVLAQNREQQQSATNLSTENYILTGFVYLGTDFPALGKTVYVVSNGNTYSAIVDQYGSFSITFSASESWEWGIEGYTTDDFVCLMSRSYGVFHVVVNINRQQ